MQHSTDLRQVEHTLNQIESALKRLSNMAREIIDRKLILNSKLTQAQEDCLKGMNYDLKSQWMTGFESGLRRLERLIDIDNMIHQVVDDYRGDTDIYLDAPEMSDEAKERLKKLM